MLAHADITSFPSVSARDVIPVQETQHPHLADDIASPASVCSLLVAAVA